MSDVLRGLKPQRVFEIFEEICAIPHGSGNTKAISDYCVDFAEKRGLWVYQDSLNNVVIKKAASDSRQGHKPVIIQGHLDMVCEKDADCDLNMETDGLSLFTEGDLIGARGTTLGGDDGIAVAMALAVLDDNTLSHPPIEVLFTIDEETGMYGAEGLDVSLLSGKRLINIDSDNEGEFTVGCAGGARAEVTLNLSKCPICNPCYIIEISGLLGGHSGAAINKGRHNSNVLMARLLASLEGDYNIVDIAGGLKDNAIPTYTKCVISTNNNPTKTAEKFALENAVSTDSGLTVTVKDAESFSSGYTVESSAQIAKLLCELPNGLQALSRDFENLPETSLNLGILYIENDSIHASFAVRSAIGEKKKALLSEIYNIAKSFGADYSDYGHYPAWEYRENSPLRDTFVKVWQDMYGKKPIVRATHGGLECGLFSDKIKGLDAISVGPDMFDIHTPRERLSISSAQRTYEFLIAVLKEL